MSLCRELRALLPKKFKMVEMSNGCVSYMYEGRACVFADIIEYSGWPAIDVVFSITERNYRSGHLYYMNPVELAGVTCCFFYKIDKIFVRHFELSNQYPRNELISWVQTNSLEDEILFKLRWA